jgi:hypothetical protein
LIASIGVLPHLISSRYSGKAFQSNLYNGDHAFCATSATFLQDLTIFAVSAAICPALASLVASIPFSNVAISHAHIKNGAICVIISGHICIALLVKF